MEKYKIHMTQGCGYILEIVDIYLQSLSKKILQVKNLFQFELTKYNVRFIILGLKMSFFYTFCEKNCGLPKQHKFFHVCFFLFHFVNLAFSW